MRIIAFDTETTGLCLFSKPFTDPGQPWPVSVTAVNSAPDGSIEEVYRPIVKIPAGTVIPAEAQNVHGISYEQTQDEGIDPKIVLGRARDLFHSADVHCAYNLPFDNKVMLALAHRMYPEKDPSTLIKWLYGKSEGICVMEQARLFLRIPGSGGFGYRRVKLAQAYKRITGQDMTGAHDATADTLGALTLFKHMLLAIPVEGEDNPHAPETV